MKKCSISLVIWKWEVKSQWDTTTHKGEWLHLESWTIPNVGKAVEQLELSYIADGNVKWYKHLGELFGHFLES